MSTELKGVKNVSVEKRRPPMVTVFLWIMGVITIITAFQYLLTYAPILAEFKGGIDLFDYLITLQMISLGITQIAVGALIDMHTK